MWGGFRKIGWGIGLQHGREGVQERIEGMCCGLHCSLWGGWIRTYICKQLHSLSNTSFLILLIQKRRGDYDREQETLDTGNA